MHRNFLRPGCAAAAGALATFLAAGPAASDPFYFSSIDYYASATAGVRSTNNSYTDSKPALGFQQSTDQDISAAAAPLAYASPDGMSFGTALMNASGHVSAGILGLDIHGTANAQAGSSDFFSDVYSASASSSANVDEKWMDQVTVSAPGHAQGEPFILHASLQLDGAASFNFNASLHDGKCGAVSVPNDSESYFGTMDVRGTGVPLPPSNQQNHWGFWRGQRSFTQGEIVSANFDPPQTIEWQQPVYQGQVTNLVIELAGSLSANAGVQGCASNLEAAGITDALTFSHTLLWGGITSITDGLGDPVTDYTLTSLSGFDYRNAATEVTPSGSVPEPGTGALLLLGMVIVARMDRRGVSRSRDKRVT